MKDNHFVFIKQQFDNSGVNAPDSLDEAVTSMLADKTPVSVQPKRLKKRIITGISAAAAVAVLTAGAVALTGLFKPLPSNTGGVLFAQTASLRGFSDRDELEGEMLRTIRISESPYRYYGAYEGGTSASAGSSSGSSSSGSSMGGNDFDASHNATYTQSVGVDEADTVKTNSRYIFYYNEFSENPAIDIFSAEGKNSKKIAEISAADTIGEDGYFVDFYVDDNRIIVFSEGYEESPDDEYYSYTITQADVFDTSDIKNIKHINGFKQTGYYVSSRMIGDTVYIVSNQYFRYEYEKPMVCGGNSATSDSAVMNEIPIGDIYTVERPSETSFLVVSSLDASNGLHVSKTKAILGSADTIYCNQDNLYITAQEYSTVQYDDLLADNVSDVVQNFIGDETYYEDNLYGYGYYYPEETQIIKVSLEKDIEFTASNKVKGIINNQYSLDEYKGNLRVATTSYDTAGGKTNNLFVLDKNLKQLGKVTGFAADEEIKAVRYINDTAYVITYMETDPLFVIDTSNPSKPEIKGEVKISGFSTMLVPVDENTLLGIGYNYRYIGSGVDVQDGIKIVTFDVTDKSNPKVLDTKVFEKYDSAVQYNPKALLVNFDRDDYTIPMHFCDYNYSDDSVTQNYGTLNFRVDNGKIKIIDQFTSSKFNGENDSAGRCVYVGDYIYLIGKVIKLDSSYNIVSEGSVIDCVKYQ